MYLGLIMPYFANSPCVYIALPYRYKNKNVISHGDTSRAYRRILWKAYAALVL